MTFQLSKLNFSCIASPLNVPSSVVRDSAQKRAECRFAAIAIIFLGESFCLNKEPQKTEPSPRRPHKPISALCISCHSLQDDNAIHPLQLGLRAPASPPSPLVTVVTASLAKADNNSRSVIPSLCLGHRYTHIVVSASPISYHFVSWSWRP